MHFLNVEAFTVSQLLNHQVIWAPPSHRLNPALGGVLRNGSIRTRFFTETVTDTATDQRQRKAGNKAIIPTHRTSLTGMVQEFF